MQGKIKVYRKLVRNALKICVCDAQCTKERGGLERNNNNNNNNNNTTQTFLFWIECRGMRAERFGLNFAPETGQLTGSFGNVWDILGLFALYRKMFNAGILGILDFDSVTL